ncbi:MAG TPA: hypothetical protein VFY63_05350 [Pseudorhizobium sp.]|nr:hypothetical protein [Pseudorhizobium sp.]
MTFASVISVRWCGQMARAMVVLSPMRFGFPPPPGKKGGPVF